MAKEEHKTSLREFASSAKVAEALKTQNERDMAILVGALGAVAKGGRAVNSDKQLTKDAKHYSSVLLGQKEGVLTSSDAGHIAKIVDAFIKPPTKR